MTGAAALGDDGPAAREDVGDRRVFEALAQRHRRALRVHCYRMLGSLNDAEDLVQETFLRAWRHRERFDGRGSARAWLYGIATNACLDVIRQRKLSGRRLWDDVPPTTGKLRGAKAPAEVWLQPYPTAEIAEAEPGPHARYEAREAVRLAFVAVIQRLPARQRAILLLCDVLGWSPREIAGLLGGSEVSVRSALQRARQTLADRYPPDRRGVHVAGPAAEALLERLMGAWQAADIEAFSALLRDDAVMHMPPWPAWFDGRAAIAGFFGEAWRHYRGLRVTATSANGQPAFAAYKLDADGGWTAHSLYVVDLAGGAVVAISAFVLELAPPLFAAFGLPLHLPAQA